MVDTPNGPLDEAQVAMLTTAFDSFKKPGTDFINPDNVGAILRMMDKPYNAATLKELIAEIDEDGSGKIELEEFFTLVAKFMNEEDIEEVTAELKEAFRLYDTEGVGFITNAVFKEILSEIDPELTSQELDGIVEEVDEDGSGTLEWEGTVYLKSLRILYDSFIKSQRKTINPIKMSSI